MPAASDASPLPQSFRPLGVRLAFYVLGALLVLVVVVTWYAFPPSIRAEFTTFQKATIFALGAMFYAGGYALARSRVVAREDGLTVVNGYRVRRFEWAEVVAITLKPGSPWAMLDLADGTSVPAMGIQGSDGPRAARQVREVRALVERFSRTEKDD
jgi:hypothetical protein